MTGRKFCQPSYEGPWQSAGVHIWAPPRCCGSATHQIPCPGEGAGRIEHDHHTWQGPPVPRKKQLLGGLHQELLQGTRHPSHCVRCVWLMSLLHVQCESTPLVHVEHSHHSLTHPCLPDAPAGLKDGRELAPSTRAPRRRRQGSLSARDAGCVSSSESRRFEGGRAPRRGASASRTCTLLSGKLHVMRACARVCWTCAMINGWTHASRS